MGDRERLAIFVDVLDVASIFALLTSSFALLPLGLGEEDRRAFLVASSCEGDEDRDRICSLLPAAFVAETSPPASLRGGGDLSLAPLPSLGLGFLLPALELLLLLLFVLSSGRSRLLLRL